jgi:hypothetical protein
MSVLSCDRRGCKNIMCDMYSHKYGYLCNECYSQLLESNLSIKCFMESNKKSFMKRNSRSEELEREFQHR